MNPVCDVCSASPAKFKCRICGRRVCDEHFRAQESVCSVCADTLCSICRKRLSLASCEVCGRIVCEECSIQVTPVIRICTFCASTYGARWPIHEIIRRDAEALAVRLSRYVSRRKTQ